MIIKRIQALYVLKHKAIVGGGSCYDFEEIKKRKRGACKKSLRISSRCAR